MDCDITKSFTEKESEDETRKYKHININLGIMQPYLFTLLGVFSGFRKFQKNAPKFFFRRLRRRTSPSRVSAPADTCSTYSTRPPTAPRTFFARFCKLPARTRAHTQRRRRTARLRAASDRFGRVSTANRDDKI